MFFFFLFFVLCLMLCKGWWMLLFLKKIVHVIVVIYLFLCMHFLLLLYHCDFVQFDLCLHFIYLCLWCYYHLIFVFEVYYMWKYWLVFFSIHSALFMILSNLDVAFFSCVQLLVTLQGCYVDLHIMFLYFGVSDINLLPHHFSYFFYVFLQFLLL